MATPVAATPVALQLYTVREEMGKDLEGTVRTVAEMGYVGVETAGHTGEVCTRLSNLFGELGLTVCSAHTSLPLGDDKARVLDDMATLGTRRIVSGFGRDRFSKVADIRKVCDSFNEAAQVAADSGMTVGYHNHWWEFLEVDGKPAYEYMVEYLDPRVFFQIDTYWVATAGQDPSEVIERLGARVPMLHIKDGPCTKEDPMVPVGKGKLDFPKIVHAGKHAEWLIVELDRCDTGMVAASRESLEYLRDQKLGRAKTP